MKPGVRVLGSFGGPRSRLGPFGLVADLLRTTPWPPTCADIPLDQLKQRYGLPASRYLEVAGMRLHVVDEGPDEADAPPSTPIVLVHGVLSSVHTWNDWTSELRRRHRVIRIDLPGFGLSEPHPRAAYEADDGVQVLEAVREALGLERLRLAGNSLGGFLSWRYACKHPERVENLVLLDPAGYPQDLLPFMKIMAGPLAPWLMPRLDPRGTVLAGITSVYGDPARIKPEILPRYVELLLGDGKRAAAAAVFRTFLRMHRHNPYLAELSTLRVPTLLLWGEDDRWIPPAHVALWRRDVPGLEVKTYPGVGHVPMEEIPAESLADVRAFWDRCAARA